MDVQRKITEVLDEHCAVIQQLTAMSSRIVQIASELVATLRRQGKVVLCGNGGSASDAQHIAAEMQQFPLIVSKPSETHASGERTQRFAYPVPSLEATLTLSKTRRSH